MKHLWDYPNLPPELQKNTDLEDKLQADVPKRSWKAKVVRHKVKEILRLLLNK